MKNGIVNRLKRNISEYTITKQSVLNSIEKSEFRQLCGEYAKYLETESVRENVILYESFAGRGIVDSPHALFEFILKEKQFSDYIHVWAINDLEDNRYFINKYCDYSNVHFVEYQSAEYLKILASAKWLVNNTTFPSYFVKRDNQIYINTWHGTPLKKMGYESERGSFDIRNIERNFLSADYLLSANDIMTKMYLSDHKLDGILPGKIIEEGYPRNDLLFKSKRDSIKNDLLSLGIKIEDNKTILLYAPTWREYGSGGMLLNAEKNLQFKKALEQGIDLDKYQLLIKPHQLVYKEIVDNNEYKDYIGDFIPSTIDTNELLSIVDLLITDYSSIFFDYLALDRPIVFFISDEEDYAKERGLYVSSEQLPGPVCSTIEEIGEAINSKSYEKYKNKYSSYKNRICKYEDGNVCKRIIDIVWNQESTYNIITSSSKKKKLLISCGYLKENGITHSFLSLLNQIDYNEWDVTAYFAIKTNDFEMQRKIKEEINSNVRVLVRVGTFVETVKQSIRREFVNNRTFEKGIWKKMYPSEVLDREFKRSFGNAKFDYIVDYNGYSRHYSSILLAGDAKKKSIWMHSDIVADMNRVVKGKKPNLKSLKFVISRLPEFDNLVSCGKKVMEVNKRNLQTQDTFGKFKYAKNTVNLNRINNMLSQDDLVSLDGIQYYVSKENPINDVIEHLSLIEMPKKEAITFVTMGRLSTEKNHENLIKAFSLFNTRVPNSNLYIIGDGPLKQKLEDTIIECDMQKNICITGNIINPFRIMKECDCFILPSLHEGQPMVLLEARACGLSIIMSDFSTAKESCYPDSQLVIGKTVDDIYNGMLSFSFGEVPKKEYDVSEYNQQAYKEFVEAIM